MAKICCSIEMEPRTLNQGQLNHAREMAADVAQKMESKEAASAIFIEGLVLKSSGVVEIKEDELRLIDEDEEKEVGVEYYCRNQKEKAKNIVEERPCQCSCNRDNIESPNPSNLKEPVTAPF